MPSLVRWKREGTVYIPGRECRRVGSENPGPPSLSSSPLTSSSSHWPPHLNYHMAFRCLKTHQNSFSPNIRSHCVRCELKQNRKWRQNGKCYTTHLRCVIVIEKQSKWRRFAHKLPRQSSLMYFSQEKKNRFVFFLTAKMACLSIDHRWSKFKGKNCKELKLPLLISSLGYKFSLGW